MAGTLSLALASGELAAAPPANISAATTSFFQKFVNDDGLVNYAAIKRNPSELKTLLRQVADFNAVAAAAPDREAFYLNAYNLLVIGEIVARYPLASVEKVPGFFDNALVSVAGEKLTLNDIENKKLRQIYHDPRIHFALVCGAKGCPHLSRMAYVGSQLDTQLTTQARHVLQDPAFIQVDAAHHEVRISQIFKWYADDFVASGKTGVAYVNQFRGAQQLPATYTVAYYPYDWTLNGQH